MNKNVTFLVLQAVLAAAAWCGEPPADPRRFIVVNRLTGELLLSEGGRLSLTTSLEKAPSALALETTEPFIPTQFVGPYIAGSVGGGEGEPGYFTVFTRQGRAVNRCWKDPTTCFSWGEHPQLAADGSALVGRSLDLDRNLTTLRSCRLPELACVTEELSGLARSEHYPLGYRDVLLVLGRNLIRFRNGNILWQSDRPLDGNVFISDVRGPEVAVVEPVAGAIHVFSLEHGRLLFSWEAPKDPAGFARALGAPTWQEAIVSRCRPRSGSENILAVREPTPAGYHPNWRAFAAALALRSASATLLPSGDLLVITGGLSGDWLECEAAPRAWIVERRTGTVGGAAELAALVGAPSAVVAQPWGGPPEVSLTPQGGAIVCTSRGCTPVSLKVLDAAL